VFEIDPFSGPLARVSRRDRPILGGLGLGRYRRRVPSTRRKIRTDVRISRNLLWRSNSASRETISSWELVEQRPCRSEIDRREALGKPIVHRRQKFVRLFAPSLVPRSRVSLAEPIPLAAQDCHKLFHGQSRPLCVTPRWRDRDSNCRSPEKSRSIRVARRFERHRLHVLILGSSADARARRPANHIIGRVEGQQRLEPPSITAIRRRSFVVIRLLWSSPFLGCPYAEGPAYGCG
jgi:hypothetical protein